MIADVSRLLDEAVGTGHPPAACACAIADDVVVHESAHGASPDSVFDVASVTKVAATTLAVAKLVASGALELDAPVARWLPRFARHGKERVTVRELLGHRSGLPAWSPFFLAVTTDARTASLFGAEPSASAWPIGRELVLSQVFDASLEQPGRRVYSDLGFLALGALVEEVASARLDAFARDSIFAPLGIEAEVGFVDLGAPSSWIAGRHVLPTGRARPREPAPGQEDRVPPPGQEAPGELGRVDDDNAFAMGGVAGHAGLFGTARAIATLGQRVLEELEGADRLGLGETLRTFAEIDPAEGPARSLGFDRPAPVGSSAGSLLGQRGPRGAIGHLGFTGCSLWIDLDRRLSVALLTNRTFPGRRFVEPIRALRPAFHDALCRALDDRVRGRDHSVGS